MASPQAIDRDTFLAHLRQSGLLNDRELADAVQLLPPSDRGKIVARALVDLGVLTRFQAERLLAGRSSGFVLDQYRILDQIGQGGMGRVYKARHRTMNRLVALKVLAPRVVQNERAQELFLREVRAVGQLVHPNIVTAYDANQTGDRYYLVLEFVDGPNLDQLVRAEGPLAVGLACDFIRQAACGLQCAHQRGMVHRDIKPANLLVQPMGANREAPGLVKVSDFGLARLHTPAAGEEPTGTIFTKPNTVMGTPDFLAPEQARCLHAADIRSDIYSLGCTLYYLLAGKVPFPGGTAMEKLIRHTAVEPEPLAQFRNDVPDDVQAILKKMTAKDPAARYQTPAELIAALELYSVSGPTPWHAVRVEEVATGPLVPQDSGERPVVGLEHTPDDSTPIPDFTALVPTTPVNPPVRPRDIMLWGGAFLAAVLGLVALIVVLANL